MTKDKKHHDVYTPCCLNTLKMTKHNKLSDLQDLFCERTNTINKLK